MILDLRAATLGDADSVADVYLRSRKELVACAPLVHSDDAVREWIRRHLIPAGAPRSRSSMIWWSGFWLCRRVPTAAGSTSSTCFPLGWGAALAHGCWNSPGASSCRLFGSTLFSAISRLEISMNAGDSRQSPSGMAPATKRSARTSSTSGNQDDDDCSNGKLRLCLGCPVRLRTDAPNAPRREAHRAATRRSDHASSPRAAY